MQRNKIVLAQDYVTVTKVPNGDFFIHDPGMTVLPDGSYIAFSPLWSRKVSSAIERPKIINNFQIDTIRTRLADKLIVSKSYDKGKTWEDICSLPYAEATPIVFEDVLYLFTQHYQHEGLYFTRSHDGGQTWENAVCVANRKIWNCQTGMVIRNRRLYWCMDEEHSKIAAISCDLDRGIMNPAAWRVSESAAVPYTPKELIYGVGKGNWLSKWPGGFALLEANVVDVRGRMMALARVVMDEYATANLCAVFHIEDGEDGLKLRFQQYYSLPGGQCKFNIVKDELSGMFWMASNLPTNSLNLLDWERHGSYPGALLRKVSWPTTKWKGS
ncbi:MAG: glycoside hydrolase [Spirochaetales bacterium]|nr:glycoside hydrolase [Spirochaetales bacterium]